MWYMRKCSSFNNLYRISNEKRIQVLLTVIKLNLQSRTYLLARSLLMNACKMKRNIIFIIQLISIEISVLYSESIWYIESNWKQKITCTWGYAPSRHPHTSKIAFGYLESRTSNFRPSSRQHFRQSATWAADTENRAKSSHELQVKDNVLNPKLLHSSGLSSAPNARCKSYKRSKDFFNT